LVGLQWLQGVEAPLTVESRVVRDVLTHTRRRGVQSCSLFSFAFGTKTRCCVGQVSSGTTAHALLRWSKRVKKTTNAGGSSKRSLLPRHGSLGPWWTRRVTTTMPQGFADGVSRTSQSSCAPAAQRKKVRERGEKRVGASSSSAGPHSRFQSIQPTGWCWVSERRRSLHVRPACLATWCTSMPLWCATCW